MPSACGYDSSSHWYTIHALLTPYSTKVLISLLSALTLWRMSNVGSQLDLRHPCMFASVLVCGRTQADKVEACSDTVPLGLAIELEIEAGFTVLTRECVYSFVRFVPDLRDKHTLIRTQI